MKPNRPYIPYSVRVQVAARQAIAAGVYPRGTEIGSWPYARQLRELLYVLFGDEKVHLDHDPALENRQKVIRRDGQIGGYTPAANDPEFLIYRIVEGHRIKTYVRGDGAQRSDVSQRRYLNRIERNRKPKKEFKPRRAKHIRRISNDAGTVVPRHDLETK